MEDQIQEQPDENTITAQINLRDTAQGIDIEVRRPNSVSPLNPAAHFAHWVGENLQALQMLAREDYNRKIEQDKAARRVLASATPRIMGPDGSPLQ